MLCTTAGHFSFAVAYSFFDVDRFLCAISRTQGEKRGGKVSDR